MSAPILAVLLSLLYSTLWFKYLRYKFYTKLSENKVFHELLLCKLCAGFWAGVLGVLTFSLFFGFSNLVDFIFEVGLLNGIVKYLLVFLALFGGMKIFFETKVGALASAYGDKIKSFILSLFFVLLVIIFPNYLTIMILFGFVNAGLTFMIFRE